MEEKDILNKEEMKITPLKNDVIKEPAKEIEELFDPQKLENSINSNLMNPNYKITEETIEKPLENNYNEIYQLQTEIKKLNQKLKEKKLAMTLSAVFSLVIIINVLWFLGVHFILIPKYEEVLKLNETMKKEYDSLKSKVDAIVGEP